MKELKSGILSQNHRRGPGPLNRNATYDENLKKAMFLHLQFLLASLRTAVHAHSSN